MANLDYKQSGVDYEPLDGFKRACQAHAATTRAALLDGQTIDGYREVAGIRGESAFLLEGHDHYLAHVEEGLGTKNLVADAVERATGQCHYRAIGIDTVATMINDLITCGADPISVAMHAAVGDGRWFASSDGVDGGLSRRAKELAQGFAEGCLQSGAIWGGGETPALKGMIVPDTIVLAGSCVGHVKPKSRLIVGDIRAGDAIVFLASSGVHTNGLTLCRAVADRLPLGFETPIGDSPLAPTFGRALLEPSVIYAKFCRKILDAGLRARYFVHVTGHGWRKLMRAPAALVYRIDEPGKIPALFDFIMQAGPIDKREAFATFNMGVGWAVYIDAADAAMCVRIAESLGHRAWVAGTVLKDDGRKAVEIPPHDIVFEEASLSVR